MAEMLQEIDSSSSTQSEFVHLIITFEDPYGFMLTSPQLPGLTFGRPTWTEFVRDAPALLRDVLAGDTRPRMVHQDVVGVGPAGDEFAIRCAEDEFFEERLVVEGAIEARIDNGRSLGALEPNELGVYQFVCARREDRMEWLAEQTDDLRSGAVHLTVVQGDRVVVRTILPRDSDWARVELGGGDTDTLGELIDAAPTFSMDLPDDARDLAPGVRIQRADRSELLIPR